MARAFTINVDCHSLERDNYAMTIKTLILKKNEDRRIRTGHLWIYSNEVDTQQTPLKSFETGEPVIVKDSRNHSLALGYINPHSLISVRILSRNYSEILNTDFLIKRLYNALSLRESLFTLPFYRMVYGEADALPGLIVDRYNHVIVVQISTQGMERVKNLITEALMAVLHPEVIIYKNDSNMRQLEELELYVETVEGNIPTTITVLENDATFEINILAAQKTGWFYDHKNNRARTQEYVKDKRVLDVFSYVGAWGIQAAMAGAQEVVCLDSSKTAIQALTNNAELNGVAKKVHTLEKDAFDGLKDLDETGEKFDVIIIDPPAFIKRKKDHKQGLAAYQRINMLALRLINNGGILVSSSCSYHLKRTELMSAIVRANKGQQKWIQVIEQGHQAPDHPIHPAIPETEYLKSLYCRVSK